jgi:hypothetical protein
LFYSQRAKNKFFKQRDNLSGQIFPFLLICLVALLAAAGVTISAGSGLKGVKTKTCVSNAADAGALAAASSWAAAFNKLVDWVKNTQNDNNDNYGYYLDPKNTYSYYKRMRFYFDQQKQKVADLTNLANDYLYLTHNLNAAYDCQRAKEWLEKAITANKYPEEACSFNPDGGYDCCHVWDRILHNQYEVKADCNAVANWLVSAAKNLRAFSILSEYIATTTDFFKMNQIGNFCSATSWMDNNYKTSLTNGMAYAFNNVCSGSTIPASLGDDFNYWIATGNFTNPDKGTTNSFFDPTSNSATYRWQSGSRFDGAKWVPKYCGVKATVDLPKILFYDIRYTSLNYPKPHTLEIIPLGIKWDSSTKRWIYFPWGLTGDPVDGDPTQTVREWTNDPFNVNAAYSLSRNMLDVAKTLRGQVVDNVDSIISRVKAEMFCCQNGCTGSDANSYDPPGNMEFDLGIILGGIDTWLTSVTAPFPPAHPPGPDDSRGNLTVDALLYWSTKNFDIWDDSKVMTLAADDTICKTVQNYPDVNTQPGLMIADIEDVYLYPTNEWKVQCTVSKFCEDDSGGAGGSTSFSIARFDGDVAASGGYDGCIWQNTPGAGGCDKYYAEITETDYNK